MNILTAVAILQLLLVVKGDEAGHRRRVGCYYLGSITERQGTLYPEGIDAAICTHLTYLHGAINNDTQEIYLKAPRDDIRTGGQSFIPRLVKLKESNPELKLILHVIFRDISWLLQEPTRRTKLIKSGTRWLNENGFDGLSFDVGSLGQEDAENMADLLCEMKTEFDKHGFSVTTSFIRSRNKPEESIRKIGRCSDQIALMVDHHSNVTHRLSPMSIVKSNVDWYIEHGIPASKISLMVPAIGLIYTLMYDDDTELGAPIFGPGEDDDEFMGGSGIRQKQLMRKLNDSSLGWIIRRDNETQEPYAFSNNKLWTSYDDAISMEYKAQYVLEKGLGGIDIVAMDFEDEEGNGEEGSFPLTRTVYNAFKRENQPDVSSD